MAYTGSVPCNWCEGTGTRKADDRTPCEYCRRHPRAISTGSRPYAAVAADSELGTCDRCSGSGRVRKFGRCVACRGYGIRPVKDMAEQASVFVPYAQQTDRVRYWDED